MKAATRLLLILLFISAGVLHLVRPKPFVRIVPPLLPAPLLLVYVSGVCEVLGGGGLLLARTRRLAGYGLLALLVAVFPANIYMAAYDVPAGDVIVPPWLLWLRLPLQALLMAGVYWVSFPPRDKGTTGPA